MQVFNGVVRQEHLHATDRPVGDGEGVDAGGAFAGNKIEQNMKKVTVYQVRVRMNDGSTRNVEVSSSVPVGSKVIVEGNNLRMA